MSETKQQSGSSDQMKIIIAALIALSTMLGATFAWRAASASSGASGADEAGLQAVSNSLEVSNLTQTSVYQHLQGYVRYLASRSLAESLDAEAGRKFDELLSHNGEFEDPLAEAQIQLLQEQLADRGHEALDRAAMSQYFLNTDYLQQDGTYDSLRELGEAEAEASRYRDVDPSPHLARADRMRAKTTNLLLVLLTLAIAVWCFVLANALRKPLQFAALGFGLVILVIAAGVGTWIELLT
jgi:hypothetical protein